MSAKLLASLMFFGTLLLFCFGLESVTRDFVLRSSFQDAGAVLKFIVFMSAVLCLFYGNAVYQLTRIGQMKRHAGFVEPSLREREAAYDDQDAPKVAILIPCYKEELSVIMQTVLSAAFAEYPDRRITLLIDDPPSVAGADLAALNATRELVRSLDDYFRSAADLFAQKASAFEETLRLHAFSPVDEHAQLCALYQSAASLVDDLELRYKQISSANFAHSDELFHREVLRRVADAHRSRMATLSTLDEQGARREYRRLACLFCVPIASFERKTFANLSHAPNKAMNLNSYISLIGGRFVSRPTGDGLLWLDQAGDGQTASFEAPPAKYVLTIDADSVILPDYLLKLVAVMEQDSGLAVAQTPYSAYRNPPSVIERTAGATTDIQYFVHQGFSALGATFWVGANALLRYDALKEIASTRHEGGQPVTVYIQDETLIEDTGSTIDLVAQGWRLHNYPQRLAYSATPPDFGALVIQRTRWANGGLIIFPILLRLLFGFKGKRISFKSFFVRTHYLLSPALANLSLMILLIVPFGPEYAHPCLILAACPYYLFTGSTCAARDITGKISGAIMP